MKTAYTAGPEIGVVWTMAGGEVRRYRRCQVRIRYCGKEIGCAESRLIDRDASSDECTAAAREASLAAIMDALEFLERISENGAAVASEVAMLRRGFDGA